MRAALLLLALLLAGCGLHTFNAYPIDADATEDSIECFHVSRDRAFASDDSFGIYCKDANGQPDR